jgi:hypothetical protein
MTLSHESESLSVKKLARQSFFDHYKQFTQLIESVDSILSGSSSKSLEGNEIRKSVMILDHITKDLQ